jgi:hypothetical protein
VVTFHEAPIDLDRSHCSREKGLPTQSTARRLTDLRGAQSGDGGGKKGTRRGGVIRLPFERGWVRQGGGGCRETRPTRGESGARAGGSLLTGGQPPATSGLKLTRQATCTVRALPTEQRGRERG